VALGVGIAIVACLLLAASGAEFAVGFVFGVPFSDIAAIVAVALAALLAVRLASRTEPAVALRTND
jgi:hypothetical protein